MRHAKKPHTNSTLGRHFSCIYFLFNLGIQIWPNLLGSLRFYLHVKGEFELCLCVGIVDLEQSMNELLQVNVAIRVEVEHGEEALANDTGQLSVLLTNSTVL